MATKFTIDMFFQTHSSFIRLHSTYLCYGFFFLVVEFLPVYSCSHLSTVLGNKFDHGAEAIVPVLFNLIPNCAKVMATSGVSAIRIIIRVSFANTHKFLSTFWLRFFEVCLSYFFSFSIFPSRLRRLLSAAHPCPPTHSPDNQ